MSDPARGLPRSAVESLFAAGRPEKVGAAVWTYLALLLRANEHGLVLVTRGRLAETLPGNDADLDRALAALSGAGLIAVKSPPPYLVITLPFWSAARESTPARTASEAAASAPAAIDVPVSKQAEEIKNKTSGERGAGEGDGLRAETIRVLGERPDDLESLLAQFPEPIVRRALRRVDLTPREQIRRSRAALFRFLLRHFASNAHGPTRNPHPPA